MPGITLRITHVLSKGGPLSYSPSQPQESSSMEINHVEKSNIFRTKNIIGNKRREAGYDTHVSRFEDISHQFERVPSYPSFLRNKNLGGRLLLQKTGPGRDRGEAQRTSKLTGRLFVLAEWLGMMPIGLAFLELT